MSIASRFAATVLMMASIAATAAAENREAAPEPTSAATKWAAEKYDAVALKVFGAPISPESLDADKLWIVTFRVRPASDADPEVQVSLSKLNSGDVNAVVTKLREPLQVQLENIYQERKDRNPSELATFIHVERVTLSARQCRALVEVARSFEKLRVPIAVENEMILDPRQYQLWVDAGSQQEYFNLLGASNGQGKHPIVVWIEQALSRVQASGKR